MRTARTLMVTALALLVAAACDPAPTPTAPAGTAPGPALNYINGPANPGRSHVMRLEDHFAFAGSDPDRGLLSANGLGVADPALSVFCGGGVPPEIMSIQFFFNDGTLHGNVQGTDVTQHVWADDVTRPVLDVICNDPPLAAGRGSFRLIDAQEFGVEGTRGWMAQGRLADPGTGQAVLYSEEQRVVLRDGVANWLVENIRLRWMEKAP